MLPLFDNVAFYLITKGIFRTTTPTIAATAATTNTHYKRAEHTATYHSSSNEANLTGKEQVERESVLKGGQAIEVAAVAVKEIYQINAVLKDTSANTTFNTLEGHGIVVNLTATHKPKTSKATKIPRATSTNPATTSHYIKSVFLYENRKKTRGERYNQTPLDNLNFIFTLATLLLLSWCSSQNTFIQQVKALPVVSIANVKAVHINNALVAPHAEVSQSSSSNSNNKHSNILNLQQSIDYPLVQTHGAAYDINGNTYNVKQPIIAATTTNSLPLTLQSATVNDTTTSTTTTKTTALKSIIVAESEIVERSTHALFLLAGNITSFANGSIAQQVIVDGIDDDDVPQIPAYIRTTAMCFCIAIMSLGVIGNIMVPIVIVKTKDMRNSTNIFLTNLSIADLLVLLICTPTVLVEVNTPPETWVLGHGMCKAVPFIELTVAHASVLTILAISFERYYAICEPLKAGYVCTKARAILICILAWCIAAVFTSPIIWVAEYKYVDYIDGSTVAACLTQAVTNWTSGYFLMIIIAFFILPLLILIVLYAIIAKNLVSSHGPMLRIRPTKPELSLKARKQVVMMLGAVVISFFLCLLPFRMLTMWIILSSDQTFFEIGLERYYSLLYFCRIMFYLNSAINPILYNLMSTKFRKGFVRIARNAWHVTASSLSCGRYTKRIRTRNGTFSGTNTNTNTNTSNTVNSNVTTSSILSRQSNRRHSDDNVTTILNPHTRHITKTQIQIQLHMPYGAHNEMLAMLQTSITVPVATGTVDDVDDEAVEEDVVQCDDERVFEEGESKNHITNWEMTSSKGEGNGREKLQQRLNQERVGRRAVHVSFDDEQPIEESVVLT